ncbi:MAG: DUF4124 domain-containing protein [Gammaproteobacteria bacterium]|nr:MAG: DUF4124 domain-containing protein [Gammaproteobacteria bacterium]
MNRMLTALFISLTCLQGHALAQAMYKWVDEHGQVHYTSTVPPSAVKHDRSVLSKRGTVVKKLEGERTPEELEAERQRQEMEAQKQKEKEIKQKHDKTLLITYKNEDDIKIARDKRMIFLDEQILGAELRLVEEKEEYKKLVKEASEIERKGHTPPEKLKYSIDMIKRNINKFKQQLAQSRQEKEIEIRSFNEDLKRYREVIGRASGN